MTNQSCEIEVSSAASLHKIRNGSETAWRTRHISVKALWMHQMAKRGIKFKYMSNAEMAADSLTKSLGASRLPRTREDLKLIEDLYVYGHAQLGQFLCCQLVNCFHSRSRFLMSHLFCGRSPSQWTSHNARIAQVCVYSSSSWSQLRTRFG